ncbi:MAG TPA: 7-carboxy-7-deazaguanine synthase [Sneathiellales bacterium]|nr:7-carboxy-7-deazaguanine synthase [Sneathiellales bacterium]
MTYSVKEIFFTLQGEGGNTGRPAVFCRFAGCNLWSGLEKDRATAQCSFCDTEFVGTDGLGGGKFDTSKNLAEAVRAEWPVGAGGTPLVVCTGGEPLLQLDEDLVTALHSTGFQIAIETNGTLAPPPGIDWVCVSPKAGTELVVTSGDELKLIFPQAGAEPELYEDLHFFLQPMDNANREENIQKTVAYCLAHPKWRLSLQTHKFLGIP